MAVVGLLADVWTAAVAEFVWLQHILLDICISVFVRRATTTAEATRRRRHRRHYHQQHQHLHHLHHQHPATTTTITTNNSRNNNDNDDGYGEGGDDTRDCVDQLID